MQKLIKPLLAEDIQEDRLYFPSNGLIVQPKIDGSAMLIQNSKAYARSLKHHENKYVTELFSKELFEGLRGEIIVGSNPVAEGLCRDTSSAIRRIEGTPKVTLFVFDFVTPDTVKLPYSERFEIAKDKVAALRESGIDYINIVPSYRVFDKEDYEAARSQSMSIGYEGVILRDPNLAFKEGRSSTTKAHLWRWKPWLDAEILVTGITEGSTNNNEATTDELGRTKRSSHQENLVPNGLVGSIQGTLVKDLLDCNGKVIQKAGKEITISPGQMTAKERKFYFENQNEIIAKFAKFTYFAYGLKDTARFANFVCIRSSVDMS